MMPSPQVADDSTLYGCCVLVDELIQRPSGLISMISDKQFAPPLSRQILTTRRCYCILSRLPFFELHFGVLNRWVFFFWQKFNVHVIPCSFSLDYSLLIGNLLQPLVVHRHTRSLIGGCIFMAWILLKVTLEHLIKSIGSWVLIKRVCIGLVKNKRRVYLNFESVWGCFENCKLPF